MYRNSSPQSSPSSPHFEATDFPTLRRVKPLPKRRRTSSDTSALPPGSHSYHHPNAHSDVNFNGNANGNGQTNGAGMIVPGGNGLPPSFHMAGLPPIPLTFPGPDASPEELLAHADALQSYYMPILGAAAAGMGVGLGSVSTNGNIGAGAGAGLETSGTRNVVVSGAEGNNPSSHFPGLQLPLLPLPVPSDGILQDFDAAQFAAQLQYAAAAAGDALGAAGAGAVPVPIPDLGGGIRDRDRDSDSDRGDGDYVDHLRQPGNTKKRKVPANHFSHSHLSREGGDMVTGIGMGPGGAERDDDEEEAALTLRLDGIGLGSGRDEGDGGGGGGVPSVSATGTGPGPGPGNTETGIGTGVGTGPTRSENQERLSLRLPSSSHLQLHQNHAHLTRLRLLSKSKRKTHLGAFEDDTLDMGTRMSAVMSAVTLAGLQHKEMIKNRKRQLAGVLSVLTNSKEKDKEGAGVVDALALEQALSEINGIYGKSAGGGGVSVGIVEDQGDKGKDKTLVSKGKVKVRLSTRKVPRMARSLKALKGKEDQENRNGVAVPECSFTFACHSATTDRVIATKQEVAYLRRKFEAELNRQATKAAKAAKAAKLAAANSKSGGTGAGAGAVAVSGSPKGGKQKRIERERERERERQRARIAAGEKEKDLDNSANGKSVVTTTATTASSLPPPLPSPLPPAGNNNKGKNTKGKKKKRSALANASNPHHLRNYVPSRLPNSGANQHGVDNNPEDMWLLPLRFLSTEIPPKHRKGTETRTDGGGKRSPQRAPDSQPLSTVQLTNPAEEWVCPFCEYELFYGDDADFRRAVRKRKAILKRRRRARERAAAAANGKLSAKKSNSNNDSNGADNGKGGNSVGVGVGGASGDAEAEFDEEAYEKDVRSGIIKDGVGVLGALNRNKERDREGEAGYG